MVDLKNSQLNAAFQLALTGRNLLVLGQAGSGKSTLIRALIDHYKNSDDKHCMVVAPTHKAALGIGGNTLASKIYKNYKLKRKLKIEDNILSVSNKLSRTISFVKHKTEEKTNVIIIDEFGMVRADDLQTLDAALKKCSDYDSEKPFGGVQIIAVGDYKQIPPVLTDQYMEEYSYYYDSIYNFCAPAFIEANFFPINITKNLRMSAHQDQVKLMEMIRKQENLGYVAQELNKLVKLDPYVLNDNLYVTKYNVVVDKINHKKLAELPNKEYLLLRKDYVYSKASFKNKIISKIGEELLRFRDPQFTEISKNKDHVKVISSEGAVKAVNESKIDKTGLEEYLVADANFEYMTEQVEPLTRQVKIKYGARVMTYFNGTSIDNKKYYNGQVFTIIGSEGKDKLVLKDVSTKEDYVIERIGLPITLRRVNKGEEILEHIGYQFQFPIILAYAQTYHKTQGMTLDEYTLDTRGKDFATGLTYVGLSRARDLCKITVTAPITEDNLKIDQEVMDFYKKFNAF